MKRVLITLYIIAASVCIADSADAGLLATGENVENGRRNADNLQMTREVDFNSGIGFAVNLLLTGEQDMGQAVKIEILRYALEAYTSLTDAEFSFADVSSEKMYEALVMYDLVSTLNLFNEEEKASLKKSLNTVLAYYVDSGICDWEDEYWSLGVTPMRIVACAALYALNFPDDPNSERYLNHSRLYLQKNLTSSIDSYGAWVSDSPGYAGYAIEYIIVTAKILRNNGFHDYFLNPRLKNLLLYEMKLLPPQQSPLVRNVFMIHGAGQTDPGRNYGVKAASAATDIYPYFPDEASNIIWYWNQCGNPSDALGVLFIDTSIPYMLPDNGSGPAGGGTAVLRDNFTRPDESVVFTGFGDADGVPDRERHDHSDHGDFSFVWKGIPVVVHDGYSPVGCSESLMNSHAWRHSIVGYDSAGDSPVVPVTTIPKHSAVVDTTETIAVADMYTDGLSQFLTTEMVDYAAGTVRLSESGMPIPGHLRHFLFIKPDALLIYDQFTAPFPVEWNLWMPVDNDLAEGNLLKLFTANDVELQVLFAGDSSVDYTVEKPAPEKKADWPLVMRTEYGSGQVTYVAIDVFAEGFTDSPTAKSFLENMVYQNGEPLENGIVTANQTLHEQLTALGLRFDYIMPSELSYLDLAKYSMLLIDVPERGVDESELNSNIGKLHEYIASGGHTVWINGSSGSMRSAGTGFIPDILELNDCDAELSKMEWTGESLKVNEDPLWLQPNIIAGDSFLSWITGLPEDESERGDMLISSKTMPASWSDSWKILASADITYPARSFSNEELGEPSRISVKHTSGNEFFTLLLPRKTGEPYRFNVRENDRGYVLFEDPVTTWEVKAGETDWTDANLSIRISSEGGFETLYAFDATVMTTESDEIIAEAPLSIYYSSKDDTGIITTNSNNGFRYSRGGMKIHAGEIQFSGLKDELIVERVAYVTTLRVLNIRRDPVPRARVSLNGSFIGVTGEDGTLPIRWSVTQPEVTAAVGESQASALLIPGEMDIVVGGILD